MGRLLLSAAILASTAVAAVPAASAQGQMPGYGTLPGYGASMQPGYGAGMMPGYGVQQACMPLCQPAAPAATATAAAPMTAEQCRLGVARAMYPLVVQMLSYASAGPAYPQGPNMRPVIGPPWRYPGFGGIYTLPFAGTPDYRIAGLYGIQQVNSLGLNNPFLTPFAAEGASTADLINNVFAASGVQQSIIGNRLAAAGLNLSFTEYPYNRADNLGSALGGLAAYGEYACPTEDSGSNQAGSSGSSTANSGQNSTRE